MKDKIEIVDRDYSSVSEVKKGSSIRLREGTFKKVYDFFRIKLLENKLKRVNSNLEKTVADVDANVDTKVVEDKIMSQSVAIARIEEKIKVLSKEEVPTNYVNSRAIKLKNDMMKELLAKEEVLYASDEKNKEESIVDNASDYGFSDFANTEFSVFAAGKKKKNDESSISREDIKDVIDEKFSELNEDKSENKEEIDKPVDDIIDRKEIENEIEKTEIEEEAKEEIKEEVKEEKAREDVYTPMTEEELNKARENIEYDKYEEKSKKITRKSIAEDISKMDFSIDKSSVKGESEQVTVDENIREDIIVTPDRDAQEEKIEDYTFVEDTPESVHFDYSDATANDLKKAVKIDTSAEGLAAIKDRAIKLKEEQSKSKAALDEARKYQTEEAERAELARKMTEEKEKEYAMYYSKFKDYVSAVQEDIEFNNRAIATAKEDAECNKRFIVSQEEKRMNYEKEMKEMLEIMGNEAINVRVIK